MRLLSHRAAGIARPTAAAMRFNHATKLANAVLTLLMTAGCAQQGQPSPTVPAGTQLKVDRTLIVAVRQEPQALNPLLVRGGFTTALTIRPFNAFLELVDDKGVGQPYLAEALPQLNADTWQVLPDGKMETRYRLKANLQWHDGAPLTAQDFVFAWQLYTAPQVPVGAVAAPPLNRMEGVTAPDDRTLVIRWSRTYPGADVLAVGQAAPGLPPVPRHILSEVFEQSEWETLNNHPYWTREFVGAGPYRLAQWEPGAFLEGAGFASHVLGAPKIDRIRVQFFLDSNTALAAMRSNSVHMASDNALSFRQGLELRDEWAATHEGTLLYTVGSYRAAAFQFRPEYAHPAAVLDARVRRAIALGTDKRQMSEALWGDQGIFLDTIFTPNTSFYGAIDQAITKYPFDPRASQQAMQEAGFTRGSDGLYGSPTGGPLSVEIKTLAGGDNDSERSVMASGLRQTGFDIQEASLGGAQAQDNQARATFSAVFTSGTNIAETNTVTQFTSAQIPGPNNRWSGGNLGGWSNDAYDKLADAFNSTLDQGARVQQRVELAKLLSSEVSFIPFYYLLGPVLYLNVLQGPVMVAPAITTGAQAWNIHQWEWVR